MGESGMEKVQGYVFAHDHIASPCGDCFYR